MRPLWLAQNFKISIEGKDCIHLSARGDPIGASIVIKGTPLGVRVLDHHTGRGLGDCVIVPTVDGRNVVETTSSSGGMCPRSRPSSSTAASPP